MQQIHALLFAMAITFSATSIFAGKDRHYAHSLRKLVKQSSSSAIETSYDLDPSKQIKEEQYLSKRKAAAILEKYQQPQSLSKSK